MIIQRRLQAGFTMVELVIALAIFSTMLIVISGAFISLVRIQASNLAVRSTTQNTRYGLDSIVREARNATTSVVKTTAATNPAIDELCLIESGGVYHYYVQNGTLYRVTDSDATCALDSTAPVKASRQALTSNDVKIVSFTAVKLASIGAESLDLTLQVATASDTGTASDCSDFSGTLNYCSVTTLESSAALRGGTGI